jgi:hypothetical protein
MKTWEDLDKEFTLLGPALQHYRVDYQYGGPDGDLAALRGIGATLPQVARFEHFAAIAGQKLSEISAKRLKPEVFKTPDPIERWYAALLHEANVAQAGATMVSERDGIRQPTTYSAHINDPARASATLAAMMSSLPKSRWAWIKTTPAKIVGAIIFLSALAVLLDYLGLKPWWIRHDTPLVTVSSAHPAATVPAPVINSAPAIISGPKSEVASAPHKEHKHTPERPYFQDPEADLRAVIPYIGDLSTLAATIKREYTGSAASHEPNSTLQKFAYQWAADEIVQRVRNGDLTLSGYPPNAVESTEIPKALWRGARLIATVSPRGVILGIVPLHTGPARPWFATTDEDAKRVEPYTHYESITTDGRKVEELWPRAPEQR